MFAGVFYRENGPKSTALSNELLSALNPYGQADVTGAWHDDSFVLAQTIVHNTAESYAEVAPYRCALSGAVIASWTRLDQRDSLAATLSLDRPLSELTDSMLIIAAWHQWGTGCTTHLQGDFAFAIADPRQRSLFLARDPVGIRPLFYQVNAAECRFGTTAAVFNRMKVWRAEPDISWVARYLLPNALARMNRTSTALRDVVKLEPGHWLLVSPDRTELHRYHCFRDDPPMTSRRDARWVNDYRAVLETVIRDQMRSSHTLGVENSGGIDSATVMSFIARELGETDNRLASFSFALCEQEPAYIQEMNQAHDIARSHVFTDPQEKSDELYERALTVLGFPQEHSVASAHTPFFEACQSANIRTLFSGFGGDEVVTNFGFHLRTELLDRRQHAALWNILPGSAFTKSLRLLKAFGTSKNYSTHSPSWQQTLVAHWPLHLIREDVVAELGLFDSYMKVSDFYAPYRRINDLALTGRLNCGYVSARLENCSLLAQSYGVDYRWPLLDTRLIQQYLSTPSIEKYGPNALGRFLHRRAIDGVVPKRVAWKPTKDMGYTNLQQHRNRIGIVAVAKEAQQQESNLHPMLDALIDRQKLRSQIKRAAKGNADPMFGFVFHQSSESIRWLNHWLHGQQID